MNCFIGYLHRSESKSTFAQLLHVPCNMTSSIHPSLSFLNFLRREGLTALDIPQLLYSWIMLILFCRRCMHTMELEHLEQHLEQS